MERKFRLGLIAKELKRFVWLGVAMLVAALIGIMVYSFAVYETTYTYEAGEHVYFKNISAESSNDQASLNIAEMKSIYQRINDQKAKDFLNEKIKAFYPEMDKPEKAYQLKYEDNVYSIRVTFAEKSRAVEIAGEYIKYVQQAVESGEYDTESKQIVSNTITNPTLLGEIGLTPFKLSAVAILAVVIVYLGVVFIVFYLNKKLYDAQEFAENFELTILEKDTKQFGYSKVAAKLLVQLKEIEAPKIVAMCGMSEMAQFCKLLEKEGYSVLTTNVESVLSKNRELLEKDGFDVLSGVEQRLKNAETCRQELKKNYQYDYIIVGTDRTSEQLITAADIADGTILRFDLKRDTYQVITGVLQEFSVCKDANILGAVL